MKKLILPFCVIALILSLVSCSHLVSDLDGSETSGNGENGGTSVNSGDGVSYTINIADDI